MKQITVQKFRFGSAILLTALLATFLVVPGHGRVATTADYLWSYFLLCLDGGYQPNPVLIPIAEKGEWSYISARGDARFVDHMVYEHLARDIWEETGHSAPERSDISINGIEIGLERSQVLDRLGAPAELDTDVSMAPPPLPPEYTFLAFGPMVTVADLRGPQVVVAFRADRVIAAWGTSLECTGKIITSGDSPEALQGALGSWDWVEYVDCFGSGDQLARGARFENLRLTVELYRNRVGLFHLSEYQDYYPRREE